MMTPGRQAPRFIKDCLGDIDVKLSRRFGSAVERRGHILDLTPQAIKVSFRMPSPQLVRDMAVGLHTLVLFVLDSLTVVASAFAKRIEVGEDYLNVVLCFEAMRPADLVAVTEICRSYEKEHPPIRITQGGGAETVVA